MEAVKFVWGIPVVVWHQNLNNKFGNILLFSIQSACLSFMYGIWYRVPVQCYLSGKGFCYADSQLSAGELLRWKLFLRKCTPVQNRSRCSKDFYHTAGNFKILRYAALWIWQWYLLRRHTVLKENMIRYLKVHSPSFCKFFLHRDNRTACI